MYEKLARFYDAVHSAETADIPFAIALAKQASDPILDLGCGTGRITIPLAQAGFTVTGVDNEAAMLAIARTKLNAISLASIGQVKLQDITKLQLDETVFRLALISQNTIMHFDSSGLRSLLLAVKKHLADDGLFLIDTANPFTLALVADQPEFELEQTLQTEQDGDVQQHARWRNDVERQLMHVEWRYELADGESVSAETTYHYLYPHILQMVMNENGFRWLETYGDYDKSAFDENSERLIIVAAKS